MLICIAVICASMVASQVTVFADDGSLGMLRGGIPNVLEKLEDGKPVTAVYFGGSITAAPGWRVIIHKWLGAKFPKAQVKMVNAGVGGTGSELGVYRMDQDVLMHKPDLVFVEFAVNDRTNAEKSPELIQRTMEGIVRKIRKQNAETDIVFLYTIHKLMVERYRAGEIPASVTIMEEVADYYGIPSINGGLRAYQLGKQGKLNVPGLPFAKGVPRFAIDDCHPNKHGHQVYADFVIETIEKLMKLPRSTNCSLPKALRKDCHEQAKMLLPSVALQFSDGWTKKDAGRFKNSMPDLWSSSKPGATATIKFKGSDLLFFDVIGPNTGQFAVTVDDKSDGSRVRFDKYCTYERSHWQSVVTGLDPEKVHTVTITVLPEHPVAKRNPKMKSKGSTINIGGVMLLGELAK